jgi:hypothetical protein
VITVQFLISVIDDRTNSALPGEMDAIDSFNDRLRAHGHWVFAGGLAAPESAMVIDNRGGHGEVTPGPVHVATEHVSGFWIIEVPNEDIARAVATEGSKACNRKVELRPFLGR